MAGSGKRGIYIGDRSCMKVQKMCLLLLSNQDGFYKKDEYEYMEIPRNRGDRPSAHGPSVSATVPLLLNDRLVRLVTRTGSPPMARICCTIDVRFAPIDSGGAIFISLWPNWMVTRVLRFLATSPRMAAREISQKLGCFSRCSMYAWYVASPIRHESPSCRSITSRVDARRARGK
jgi:hypothetical protein